MSVYRHKGSPFYYFDFQTKGIRFSGSTGCTSRREAQAVENAEREKAKVLLTSGSANAADLTVSDAALRYWTEVGEHHACASETFANLERLVDYFGKDKRLSEIADNDVTMLVAWRRGHRRWGRRGDALISPATVNRSTTEVLQKLFTRAKRNWGARFDHEPSWREHMLREPAEHIRELRAEEADAIRLAIRMDYAPFLAFARASGFACGSACLDGPRWIGMLALSRRRARAAASSLFPSDEIEAILRPLIGDHAVFEFTYRALRTRSGRIKGHRYPITFSGAKTQWRRTRARAGIVGFRFHDFRHDLGTKLLRQTGNLKLVQRALNHADLKTTTRYAHVLDNEIAEALERVQAAQNSRNKSRRTNRKAS